MRSLCPLGHPGRLQLDMVIAEVLEQAAAGAEQHRYEVHVDLVDEPGTDELLTDVAADDVDVLFTRGGSCLFDGFLGTVDEGVDACFGYVLGLAVRDDEQDRKSTRLNSSHVKISYAVFC